MPLDDCSHTGAAQSHHGTSSTSTPATTGPTVRAIGSSTFANWGPGGIGPLISRVRREFHGVDDGATLLTPEELVRLVNYFKDEPLPLEIRSVLEQELLGTRKKKKTGPKPEGSLQSQFQDALLSSVYADGLATGEKIRTWRKARRGAYPRSRGAYVIPPARAYACRRVRRWLPKFRDMTDAAISNRLSMKHREAGGRSKGDDSAE